MGGVVVHGARGTVELQFGRVDVSEGGNGQDQGHLRLLARQHCKDKAEKTLLKYFFFLKSHMKINVKGIFFLPVPAGSDIISPEKKKKKKKGHNRQKHQEMKQPLPRGRYY